MELEIKDIIQIILKKIVMIIVITMLGAGGTYIVSTAILEDIYETSTTMFISSNKSNTENTILTYNDYNLNIKLVNSYRELCKTERVLNKVIEKLDSNLTLTQLSNSITVSSINDTEIIKITVQDTKPTRAQEIANATATVFMTEISDIMKMDNVQIIDEARKPNNPIKPNVLMNTGIGAILGLMISIGLAFILAYFNTTITTIEEVQILFNVPVLASIPHLSVQER